jgi:hypothetical protein
VGAAVFMGSRHAYFTKQIGHFTFRFGKEKKKIIVESHIYSFDIFTKVILDQCFDGINSYFIVN